LSVPVIALSQLSRAVETRGGDKRPQLSDLRESGSIEQDADMVMFLYRPEYYGITQDENGMPTQGIGEIIIAKHRNGSLENVQLKFIGKYTKFTDIDVSSMGGSYGSTFPTSGAANFESGSGNSMTFQSKANSKDTPPSLPPSGEDAPF
jgi:replicative DNA helicase